MIGPGDAENLGRKIQVCFFFNAQRHQLLHGIATAVEMARMPGFDVYVVSPAASHVEYARTVAERLGGAPITFVHARSKLLAASMLRTGSVIPPKLLSLMVLARWLNRFDAICLPERTSMILRRMGVRRPRFVHLDHGAGDRAAGFDRRISRFDFVLMAGTKHRERLMGERLVTPGKHAVVGYPKFEAADAIRDHDWYPFAERRPVVLYNPHFSRLGSWTPWSEAILAAFAAQGRYNLLVAPHVRLLDTHDARERWGAMLDRFDTLGHIHVDRGSDRAIDMTHTSLADLYLGDVSSQVYEFLRTPRPCLFLNAHGVDWRDDENYAHWHFGEVIEHVDDLCGSVDNAFARHGEFAATQAAGMARTFSMDGGASTAAAVVAEYLATVVPRPVFPRSIAGPKPWRSGRFILALQRAAMLSSLLVGGWFLSEGLHPAPTTAATRPFLDRAVASHHRSPARHVEPARKIFAAYWSRH